MRASNFPIRISTSSISNFKAFSLFKPSTDEGKIIHRVKLYRIVINAHIIKFMPFLRQLPILVFAFCEVFPGRLTLFHLTICARYLSQKFYLKLINKVK